VSAPGRPARPPNAPTVGNAAERRPGGNDTSDGGNWLGEITQTPEDAAPGPQGVPLDTKPRHDRHKGRAVESKRGQRGG
jgi:hypothetical protein